MAARQGSVVNHVGFIVDNVQQRVAQWKAAGVTVLPGNNNRLDQAFVETPDGVRMEILEDKTQIVPIRNEHVHFVAAGSRNSQSAGLVCEDLRRQGRHPQQRAGRGPSGRADPVRQGRHEAGADARARARPHRFRREGPRSLREEDRGGRHQARRAGSQESPHGNTITYITDPWGTRIEIIQRAPLGPLVQ